MAEATAASVALLGEQQVDAAAPRVGPGLSRVVAFCAAMLLAVAWEFGGLFGLTASTWRGLQWQGPLGVFVSILLLALPFSDAASTGALRWIATGLASRVARYLGSMILLVSVALLLIDRDPAFSTVVGFGVVQGAALLFTHLQTQVGWAGAARFRIACALCWGTGGSIVALFSALSVAELLGNQLLQRLSETKLEGLVPAGQGLLVAVMLIGSLWAGRAGWRLVARRQLAGKSSEAAATEVLWFVGLSWFIYPVIACSPLWMMIGLPPSLHFFQSTVIAGCLSGPLFGCLLLLIDRPRATDVSPLFILLPDAQASAAAERLAAAIAAKWQRGPVTMLAHPDLAQRARGAHLRMAEAVGVAGSLFPALPEQIERYRLGLPPVYAWSALRRRECYLRGQAWDEAFRSLVPPAARVVVLASNALVGEARELVARLLKHVAVKNVVAVAPSSVAVELPDSQHVVSTDRSVRDLAKNVLDRLRVRSSGQALRQIVIGYIEEDAPIAEALAAQLNRRYDATGALVESWAQSIPAVIDDPWLFRQRGYVLLAALAHARDELLQRLDQKAARTGFGRISRALAAAFFRIIIPFQRPDGVFVLLERPRAQKPARDHQAVLLNGRLIGQFFSSAIAVRLGEPFGAAESSVFGASEHAGWINLGPNTELAARDVAKRLLEGQTEALAPLRESDASGVTSTSKGAAAQPTVLLTCARADQSPLRGAIESILVDKLGRDHVLVDLEISPSESWREALAAQALRADVVVVLIGPSYRQILRDGEATATWVDVALETAVSNGTKIVPVWLDSHEPLAAASLPRGRQALAELTALPIEPGPRFDEGMAKLLSAVGYAPPRASLLRRSAPLALGVSAVVAGLVAWERLPTSPSGSDVGGSSSTGAVASNPAGASQGGGDSGSGGAASGGSGGDQRGRGGGVATIVEKCKLTVTPRLTTAFSPPLAPPKTFQLGSGGKTRLADTVGKLIELEPGEYDIAFPPTAGIVPNQTFRIQCQTGAIYSKPLMLRTVDGVVRVTGVPADTVVTVNGSLVKPDGAGNRFPPGKISVNAAGLPTKNATLASGQVLIINLSPKAQP